MHIGILAAKLTSHSGWEHYSLSLIEALQAAGVQVTVIVPHSSKPLAHINVLPLLPDVTPMESRFSFKLLHSYPAVSSALRHCDIIHNLVEVYAPLAWAVARQRPHVMTAHGSYAHYPQVRRWPLSSLYKTAYQHATMVCVSHYTEHIVRQVIPNANTLVINNGVDVNRYTDLPSLSSPKRGPTIVTAGGVKRRKGTLELIRAVAHVREQFPNVQCIIMGTTEAEKNYAAQVRQEIDHLQLQDNVHLLGFVSDDILLAWYGAADIFVLPSINDNWKFEGFGLVHLEASAAGLPVIGTDNSGVVDAIEQGVTGIIVSQANVAEELPQAILSLLKDPDRAKKMGAAGRAKAQQHTWAHVAQQMITLYARLLSHK